MKSCPVCGKEIKDEYLICVECGLKAGRSRAPFSPSPSPKKQELSTPLAYWVIPFLVVVIFILLAVPAFRGLGHHQYQEAKTNLGAIYTAQTSYYGEKNTFSGDFDQINWAPQGQPRYTYFLPNEIIINNRDGTECRELPPDIKPEVSKTGFTAIASGNIDKDSTCDIWSINDAKVLNNLVNDETN